MQRRGHAANIIAVAHGKQRQDTDGRVLQSVQAAGKIEPRFFKTRFNPIRQVKPQSNSGEGLWGQVKRLLTDYLFGILRFLFEAHDMVGNLDLPQV